MASIKFDITGDNQNFLNAMNGVRTSVHQTVQDVERSGESIENMFGRIAGLAGVAFSTATVSSFIDKVKETRSYFQDIESSMEVFLGSQEKAADFTEKLKKYAYYNMFEFSDLAAASKQMIAYKTNIEDVIPELDKLSNIATGTKQPLMELVSMYNNARSVGMIGTQQLGMWARAGIVLRDELKEMGQEVTKSGVTFQQLQMVIDKMTSEGGMFHNLMANQMENISAEAGQLEDTLALMYDEIGERYQDIIVKGYKAASEAAEELPQKMQPVLDAAASGAEFLIDHYKEIGTILMSLIATYGMYKAALVTVNASEKAVQNYNYKAETKALDEQIKLLQQLSFQKDLIASEDLKEAVAAGKLTEEREKLLETKRQELAMKVSKGELTMDQADEINQKQTMLAFLDQEQETNMRIAEEKVSMLQEEKDMYDELIPLYQKESDEKNAALEAAKQRLENANALVEKTQKELELAQQIAEETGEEVDEGAVEEAKAAVVEQLTAATELETVAEEANTAADKLNQIQEESSIVTKNLDTAVEQKNTMAMNMNTASTQGNTLATRLHTVATTVGTQVSLVFRAAVLQVKTAFDALKTSIMTNPIGILIGALTIAIPLLMSFTGGEDDASDSAKKFGESADEAVTKVKSLVAVLNTVNKGSKANKDAMNELKNAYDEYGIQLDEDIMKSDDEVEKCKELIAQKEKLIEVIRREAIEREAANEVSSASDAYEEELNKIKEKIKEMMGEGWSDAAKNQFVENFITDEYIENITKAYNKWSETVKDGNYYTEEAVKANNEYKNALASLDGVIEKMAASLEVSDEAVIEAKNATRSYGSEIARQKNAFDEAIEATNAAREAALGQAEALDVDNAKLLLNKKSLSEVKTFLDDLAKRNRIDIDVNIKYNEDEMPDVLKNLTSEQWLNRARQYSAIASTMKPGERRHVKDAYTGKGTTMTYEEVMNEANRSASASQDKKRKEEEEASKKKQEADEAAKKAKELARQAKQKRDQKAKEIEENLKYNDELSDLEVELIRARTDAKIAAVKDGYLRERMEADEQHRRNIEDIQSQEDEIYKAIYEQRKKVYENAHKGEKYENTAAGAAGWGKDEIGELSEEEQEYFDLRYSIIVSNIDKENAEYDRALEERAKTQRQELTDFLKTYGDYEQQKLAITQEYEEKIREASSPVEAAKYTLEMQEALEQLDTEKLGSEIDWSGVFSELEGHTKEYLIGLRNQLQTLLDSGTVTDLTQMETIQNKIQAINDEISKQSGLFDFVGDRQREHNRLVEASVAAEQRRKEAIEKEVYLQSELEAVQEKIRNTLEQSGIDRDTDIDQGLLDQFDANSEEYKVMKDLLSQLAVGEGKLAKARINTANATRQAEQSEDSAERDSAQAVADWFADAQQFISEKGIDQLPELLETLGYGTAGEKIQQGLTGFNDAAGAAADFASGNYVGAALKGFNAVKNFGEALGVFSGVELSDSTYHEDMESLNKSNELLNKSIDNLADVMKNAKTSDIVQAASAQMEAYNDLVENTNEQLSRTLSLWEEGGTWHSDKDSAGADIADAFTDEMWEKMSEITGYDFMQHSRYHDVNIMGRTYKNGMDERSDRAEAIANLTPQQVRDIRDKNPALWRQLLEAASGGVEGADKYLEEYAALADRLDEIQEQQLEALTGISFDSMKSEFLSACKDMDKGAEQLADNFEEYLKDAILNAFSAEFVDDKLKNWRKAVASFMANDGQITEDELYMLRHGGKYKDLETGEMIDFEGLDSIQEDVHKGQEMLRDLGLDTSKIAQQSSTFNSAQSITYEQADALTGIGINHTMLLEQGNMTRDLILANITSMNNSITGDGGIKALMVSANATRDLMYNEMKGFVGKMVDGFNKVVSELQNQ